MTKSEGQLRISELKEYIAFQEKSLDIGARKLKELNDQYNITDREYKELVIKKNKLIEEITALTQTADLYSNF